MKVTLHRYAVPAGWSDPLPADADGTRTLVLAFCAPQRDAIQPALDDLARAFPNSQVIGCSTAGEIMGVEITDLSVVVAVVRFDQVTLGCAVAKVESADQSAPAGVALAEQLLAAAPPGESLGAVLVLSEGLTVNGSELIRGLNSKLPDGVVVTGGLAGDGEAFNRTWVLTPQGAHSGVAVAAGFYGDALRVGHGSRGGWDLLGPEREVTRSQDNVLIELDGQPALETYKRYLGDRASGLPATGLLFPLAIRDPDAPDELKVRTILAVDEAQQSITFAGDIPQGRMVRLMRANFDRLIDGAGSAAEGMMEGFSVPGDTLCVVISCVGRRLVLGERSEEELEAVAEFLPSGTASLGYYSYGEISPLTSGRCDLHNQTMTLTLIGERI